MESDPRLAAATPPERAEGRTTLARAVEAVLNDSAKTEQSKEQPRKTAQGGFKAINPNNRSNVIENSGKEPPITDSVVKESEENKPVLKHLDLGLLGIIIQNAIEAAKYQDKISGSDSTMIETIFRDYPITVTANSDAMEAVVDWACHREQKKLQKYYDDAAEELRKADEELKKSGFREIWMSAFNFCVGVAFTWISLSMFPNLTFPEYGAHLLRLLRSVTE